MLNDQDLKKLAQLLPTKEEFSALEKTVNEIAETLNEHSEKLDNLASKHDLEEMLDRSVSLTALKTEHELIKKILREKLDANI